MARKGYVMLTVLFSVFQLFLNAGQTQKAKGPLRPTHHIKKTTGNIKIDGYINESAWGDALVISMENEIMPNENVEPPVKTQCLAVYDDKNFYVAFKAYDPHPHRIRAHLSDRDSSWQDDLVAVLIDTFNDENRAFAFFANPLGVQMDEIFSNGGTSEDESWDAIWSSAGHINDSGYEVEIAIPFRALQFPRTKESQTWGFAPVRIYPRSQRHQITNFRHNRSNSCLLCQSHKLIGIQGVSPGENIELDPTVTAFRTDERKNFPDGTIEEADPKVDAGISGHWRFTTNLTLSATINPDFSHVEADEAQLDINKQFALYYAEKRPFFLEGIDFFSTHINAVYTRTLADPSWGLKISGKEGKNAIGIFVCRDEITNFLFPGAEGSKNTTLNQGATAAVLRYRSDIGPSSTLGLLITDREGQGYHNRLAGADGLFRISNSDTIRFLVLGSSTRYPGYIVREFEQKQETMTGFATTLSYRRDARTYGWRLVYEDLSPDFRADLGFIGQVNYRRAVVGGYYTYWGKEGSFFSRICIDGDVNLTRDHDGNLLEQEAEVIVDCEMRLQSYFSINGGTREKVYRSVSFNQDFLDVSFRFRPTAHLFLGFTTSLRDEIDYIHIRPGKYFDIEPELEYNFGKHLQVTFSYSFSRLNVEGEKLFQTHLFQGRLLYHFSKRAFLRGIFQYTDISRNTGLYADEVEPEYHRLFTQFLFSYKLNPRTVLFLGYSDNYNGFLDIPLKQVDRTFFLKIGYALSF